MFVPPQRMEDIPTVEQLIALADEKVAGLERQKRRLALLIHRHMVAAFLDEEIARPPNVLVLGDTGHGKTWLLSVMLEAAGLPWGMGNVLEHSPPGFQGRDLPLIYLSLLHRRYRGEDGVDEKPHSARQMTALAERWGVMVLDEFDKMRWTSQALSDKDFTRPMQYELLRYVEGARLDIREVESGRGFPFDTSRVLHIAAGAFEGLGELQLRRDGRRTGPDGRYTEQEIHSVTMDVDPSDIMAYGFLGELVGRFSTILPFPRLDAPAMGRILREHTLPSYEAAMRAQGLVLEVDKSGIAYLAGVAAKSKVGARGIVPLLEEVLGVAWSHAQPGDTICFGAAEVSQRMAKVRPGRRAA